MKWFARRKFAIIGTAFLTTACIPSPEIRATPVTIQSQPIQRPALNLPPVDPFRARDVEWVVVTPENADRIFNEMRARGQAPALFGVDERGYENISVNTQESLRVVLQQQAVIDGYRAYYLRVGKQIDEFNSSLNQ